MHLPRRIIRGLLACLIGLACLASAPASAEPLLFDLQPLPFSGNEIRAGVPKAAAVLGDRFVYRTDDEPGQFHAVVLPPAAGDLTGCQWQVTLAAEGGAEPIERVAVEATHAKAHFRVRVAQLPPGRYTTTTALLDAKGAAVGDAATFTFTRSDERHETPIWPADGLPLTLPEQAHLPEVTWPTFAPLPLPIGLVHDVAELSLTDDGKPAAAQFIAAGRWGPTADASLKWVHVHFLARYREGRPATYRVQRDGTAADHDHAAIDVQQDETTITVDTGVMKFVVNRKAFAGVSQAWVDPSGRRQYDDTTQVVAGETGGPYVMDGRMIRFDSQHGVDVQVEVEEAGPVRTVIRARGWYGSEEKRVPPICLFNTRLIAHAGQPTLRVQQQTILGYDTRLQRLADVGFTFVTARGQRVEMGVDGQTIAGDLPQGERTVYLHQDRFDHLRVVSLNKEELQGKRSDGWFRLLPAGENGGAENNLGMTVALRDVWQKFPKEVELSRAGLTLHFWPAHGHRAFTLDEELSLDEIYKFWCFHQHRLLDLNLPPDYFQALQGYPGTTENVPQHALNGNGQGLSISNDFLVVFGNDSEKAQNPAGLAAMHQADPGALPPVAWNAATGAMGQIAAADDPAHAQTEHAIENAYLSYTRSVERGNAYGMWNYADTHTYWDATRDRAELHRVWHNSHYHEAGKTWLLYFRSGSRDLLDWARASTDHYINIDTINWADSENPENQLKFHVPGAMYHCKGQTHWGSEVYGMRRRDSHAGLWGHWVDPDAALWSWLIDGNLRARDVYQLWHESIRKHGIAYRGTRREINTSMAIACTLYEATWDADLLPNIHGMGVSLRTAEPLEEQNPGPMWHPLWMNRYVELTRDPRYTPFVLEHGSKVGIKDTWVVALSGLAYQLSGEPSYLQIHFDRLLEMPRHMYRHTGDAYDWFGWGPGPLGSRWFWMGWPTYLKQLQRSGLAVTRQSEPSGGYPYTSARPLPIDGPASLTVYLLEPTDGPIPLDFRITSLGGDLHATSLRVLSPSGKVVRQEDRLGSGGYSVHDQHELGSDGETGLYKVEFRGHEANVGGPISNVAVEGAAARTATAYRTARVYSHVQPIPAAVPMTLTIRSTSDRTPCDAIVRDGEGKVIAAGSLFRPRPQKELVVSLDPSQHPLPWLIDVVGLSSLTFDGEAEAVLMTPTPEAIKALAEAMTQEPR